MFEFLKNKLKEVVSKFSKKIDEEAKTIEEPAKAQPAPEPPKKAEEKAQPKVEPKAAEQPKPAPAPKPTPKPEPKEEPRPAPKPEPKPESKPIPKAEQKKETPEHIPEEKADLAKLKSEEKKAKPMPETRPEPKPVPKPESVPEQRKAESKPLPKEEPKQVPKEKPHAESRPVVEEEPKPAPKEPEKEKHSFFDFLKKQPKKEETQLPKAEEKKPEPLPEPELKPIPKEEPKADAPKNIFSILKEKITKKELNEQQFEELFWELEVILLENNVAVEVIDKIKADLKQSLVNTPLERNRIDQIIESTLKRTIQELFDVKSIDMVKLAKAKQPKPFIICFVGINGSGKTTSIAKIAHLLKKKGLTSVMAASDTFRAAAIQQLEEHADRLNIKLIKHDYGADSAAVAFDAISHAKAHNIDVVLIDTAGRLQSNTNLMDELKKVKRITKPDLIIFVGESITGNDCVEQAKTFDSDIGIDGIILSKSDIDEKGGAAISISYITHKPILYLGTGQGYDDLTQFDPEIIIRSLGLEG